MITFGALIREYRVNCDLTIRELALLTGFSSDQIARLERGAERPPSEEYQIDAICKALKMEDGDILSLKKIAELERKVDTQREQETIIPLMFRTISNSDPAAEEIRDLARYLNEHE